MATVANDLGSLSIWHLLYVSDGDASGLEFAGAHQGRERARAAFARSLAAVRTCVSISGSVRVRADEEVSGPGRIRLVQLVFRHKCCTTDTHTFGVIRRGSRTAVVKRGEIRVSSAASMRNVLRTASARLAR